MQIVTIGFTQSSAEHFFERLKAARVERLVDIRLHNSSQLAGFAKASDLAYLLDRIAGISYEHDLRLAPTEELLKGFRSGGDSLAEMQRRFQALMQERGIPDALDRFAFERKTVLLCSEAKPTRCHRSIVADILAGRWGAAVEHL